MEAQIAKIRRGEGSEGQKIRFREDGNYKELAIPK